MINERVESVGSVHVYVIFSHFIIIINVFCSTPSFSFYCSSWKLWQEDLQQPIGIEWVFFLTFLECWTIVSCLICLKFRQSMKQKPSWRPPFLVIIRQQNALMQSLLCGIIWWPKWAVVESMTIKILSCLITGPRISIIGPFLRHVVCFLT